MITAALCVSYQAEIAAGVHTRDDTYMLALYTAEAQLNGATRVYSPAGESAGKGYTAGGRALPTMVVGLEREDVVVAFPSETPLTWPEATITARGGLIYNASKGNRAVAVLDFSEDVRSTNGPYIVDVPNPVIRMRAING